MLYVVMGILKPGSDAEVESLADQFNEHLAQPFRAIRAAGALRDREGRRTGYMAFIDGEDFEEGERYLRESPFYQAGLYERVEVAQLSIEVGRLSA